MALQSVKIGLLGLGTVGQAVVNRCQEFDGQSFHVVGAAVRDVTRVRTTPTIPLTTNPYDIINNPAIDVVVEVTGGRDLPREWILACLRQGKAVVTANKELMAYHGDELSLESFKHRVYLGYEASVGGGIPILDPLHYHLTSAPIEEIYGVINGTSNYLLTEMSHGHPFETALREAQRQGYAEMNPSADVDGHDAVRKLALLIRLGLQISVSPDVIAVSGLKPWPETLFQRIREAGYVIRLVALAKRVSDHQVKAQVEPMAVPLSSHLGRLQGTTNGIGVTSPAGRFWVEGPGAGGEATATSIWADIRRSQHTVVPSSGGPLKEQAQVDRVPLKTLVVSHDPDRSLELFRGDRHPISNDKSVVIGESRTDEGLWTFPLWEGQ